MPSTYGQRWPPDQIAGGLGAAPPGGARNRNQAARNGTTLTQASPRLQDPYISTYSEGLTATPVPRSGRQVPSTPTM
ncbi:hypothetical protein GCM10011609_41610 [Lentzea pudingi]|uniref:Uncharacterized protein n=1 Tax=Lentzea pudingi TaxID=1789439 RepID=A0ABQ2I323_9PSEU|nr:hypothetical protein GCM10011609_41610 [Lentzea pudingi]